MQKTMKSEDGSKQFKLSVQGCFFFFCSVKCFFPRLEAKRKRVLTSAKWENHNKSLGGDFRDSEVIVLLGENGTGKTTFIRMLAGNLDPDLDANGEKPELPKLAVSYKPQKIAPKFEGTVRELMHKVGI